VNSHNQTNIHIANGSISVGYVYICLIDRWRGNDGNTLIDRWRGTYGDTFIDRWHGNCGDTLIDRWCGNYGESY